MKIPMYKRLLNRILRPMPDDRYLKFKFRLRKHRGLNLKNPKTYDEKLQWLKLYDRNPIHAVMVDKYAVKNYVAELIGGKHVIPTLGIYDRFDEIDFDRLPDQFVIKCMHDSGGLIVCENKSEFDVKAARKKINSCLRRNYFWGSREWPYKNVKPRILVEQYLELGEKDVHFDYKFMCFDGAVKALFLDIGVIGDDGGHAEQYYRNVYDRDFNLLPVLETRENSPLAVKKPENYEEMVAIAEKLSAGFAHLRVDLYNVKGRIYFGELTFYHGSGYNDFRPAEWDRIFGDWITLPISESET